MIKDTEVRSYALEGTTYTAPQSLTGGAIDFRRHHMASLRVPNPFLTTFFPYLRVYTSPFHSWNTKSVFTLIPIQNSKLVPKGVP